MSRKITDADYVAGNVPGHYFLDLSVENVRCFGRRQTLRLADERGRPHHWTIILGENGTGKTSLLKSLVAVAPSPKQLFGKGVQKLHLYPGLVDWQAQWDTRRQDKTVHSLFCANVRTAHAFAKPVKSGPIPPELHLEVRNRHVGSPSLDYTAPSYEQLGDFLCFAYGASRRMGNAALSGDKYSTASVSLFDDGAPLINVEEFFMQADYEAKTSRSRSALLQRQKVKDLLIDILPDVRDLRIRKAGRAGRQVEVNTPFGWVRLSELSLGYKSLIAWVVDFASRMYHYHRAHANPFHAPAVVLVDEIDLHMHPKWQRKILSYLSKRFPNTQFIATAHSPLIVQAAANANLVLLKRRGAQVLIETAPDQVKSWRIDQILTSDLFGLSSARGVDTEKLLVQRRKLLMKPKVTNSTQKKIETLEAKLGSIPVAETKEYIEAMQIIEKAAQVRSKAAA